MLSHFTFSMFCAATYCDEEDHLFQFPKDPPTKAKWVKWAQVHVAILSHNAEQGCAIAKGIYSTLASTATVMLISKFVIYAVIILWHYEHATRTDTNTTH